MSPLTYKVFNICCFIRCGTYNSHLYTTTLPLKCESINSSCSPFKRKLLLACIAVASFSANGPTLYRRCCFLRKRTGCLSRTRRRTGLWYHCWVTGGKSGGRPTSSLEQPHLQERRRTLTQNLKAMGLWVILLIRCSTFTLLSDVGHITHTCTQQHNIYKIMRKNMFDSTFTSNHVFPLPGGNDYSTSDSNAKTFYLAITQSFSGNAEQFSW